MLPQAGSMQLASPASHNPYQPASQPARHTHKNTYTHTCTHHPVCAPSTRLPLVSGALPSHRTYAHSCSGSRFTPGRLVSTSATSCPNHVTPPAPLQAGNSKQQWHRSDASTSAGITAKAARIVRLWYRECRQSQQQAMQASKLPIPHPVLSSTNTLTCHAPGSHVGEGRLAAEAGVGAELDAGDGAALVLDVREAHAVENCDLHTNKQPASEQTGTARTRMPGAPFGSRRVSWAGSHPSGPANRLADGDNTA